MTTETNTTSTGTVIAAPTEVLPPAEPFGYSGNYSDYSGDYRGGLPAQKSTGNVITAADYQNMITVLNNLTSHSHTFYDDYTTVCQCQCQCDCTRGTL